jgi:hypothetical protein
MPDISIDADKLNAILTSVQKVIEDNKRLERQAAERTRADAATAENFQRQRSMSIAAEIEDRHKGRAIQEDWDNILQRFGRQAPAQKEGETSDAYERRLAFSLQFVSPEWKDVDLNTAPSILVRNIIKDIKADALKPGAVAMDTPPGIIREIKTKDKITGRDQSEFVSSDGTTFIHQLAGARPRRILSRILGLDRIGSAGNTPIENPERMGRMPLRQGFPR